MEPPSPPTRTPWHITSIGCLWASAIFIALTFIALPLDLSLAGWIRENHIRGDPERLIMLCEVFGYGGSATLIVITAAVLDPRGWRIMPRLLLGVWGAGLLADFCKVFFIARWRPNAPDFQPAGFRDSFVQWLPWLGREKLPAEWNRHLMSFPSGHTATAAGLAIALSILYPRGTLWFFILAFFAALQRIESRAHYLSDTLAGAAVACLFTALVLHSPWLENRLRKLEGRIPVDSNA
jgi:membrane-associated phospholipid phosphatase